MAITKEEIQNLPLIAYSDEIKLISTQEEWLSAYEELKDEKILGFDTETKPTYVKGPLNPPALMQLASAKAVYIIRLSKLGLLPSMIEILSNPEIIKTGVAIGDDMIFLQKKGIFKPAGHVDIAPIAKKKGYTSAGLRTLCAEVLGGRLSKAMRCSNWEKQELTPAQITYAATDAWVSYILYTLLIKEDTKNRELAARSPS